MHSEANLNLPALSGQNNEQGSQEFQQAHELQIANLKADVLEGFSKGVISQVLEISTVAFFSFLFLYLQRFEPLIPSYIPLFVLLFYGTFKVVRSLVRLSFQKLVNTY